MTAHDVFLRYRPGLIQFVRFGLVGVAGVVVNQVVLICVNVIFRDVVGQTENHVILPIPLTDFNVRNYHAYVVVGFLAANFFNFMLNRYWTFRTGQRAPMWHEYWPFLIVGLAAQAIGLLLMTGLMNTGSPIALPSSVFDNSTGFRTKLYWANLIVIVCVMPINFVLNKLWTFQFARRRHAVAVPGAPAGVDAPAPVATHTSGAAR